MKENCRRCLLKDKSKAACVKRQCQHANIPKTPPKPEKWPIKEGSVIKGGTVSIKVDWLDKDSGHFVARVLSLSGKESSTQHGHFGSYVSKGRYYRFKLISDGGDYFIWGIPDEGTERFHREGHTGAQFLLAWDKSTGFSFDLDS
jgi:hypothetical protein